MLHLFGLTQKQDITTNYYKTVILRFISYFIITINFYNTQNKKQHRYQHKLSRKKSYRINEFD